jgi:glutamate synthase domain-containing protein 2
MENIVSILKEHYVVASLSSVFLLILLFDLFQKKYAVLRNFPVVGHLRYLLQMIGPEMRQYWVANDKEEQPFNRSERDWIYFSSRKENNTFGFGTSENIYGTGYPIIKNAGIPFPNDKKYKLEDPTAIPCLKVMGLAHGRKRPYRPSSIINISAMSFGSLSSRAISSLNIGAKRANIYHNTGEGGISPYHLHGADLMWQMGTGYFAARDKEGNFDIEMLAKKVEQYPQVRCIEIKLSQGAKPGKGGILPGAKVTAQISEIRGIPIGKDCISPNYHAEFSSADGLIDFVEKIAQRTGLPVGIKGAVGSLGFWEDLAGLMKKRNAGPDFITIDGGEGGTGAAPLTFADHVSLPFKVAFARVYQIFQKEGIADDIVWIGSGKLGFPDRAIIAFVLGCDLIQIARESMLSIGCIQAQQCHTGHCPVGVATQNPWLEKGIDVETKALRVLNYIQSFRKEILSLAHASGHQHPLEFNFDDIEFSTGVNKFSNVEEIFGYTRSPVKFTDINDYQDYL